MRFMRRYLEESNMLKDRILIFHFFITDNFEENVAYNIHKECLKKYSSVFTEMRFFLSVTDLKDKERIKRGIDWILSITDDIPIMIKVVKNDALCETRTFHDEVLAKLDTFDGLVCFAQGKGFSKFAESFTDKNESAESVARWITALYYFNFNFMDEMEGKLFGLRAATETFYGPLLGYQDTYNCESHHMYCGTFFWLNPRMLKEKIAKKGLPIITDRYYTENFPGNVCDRKLWGDGLSSHNDMAFLGNEFDLYRMNRDKWQNLSIVLKEPNFMEFSDKILNNVNFFDKDYK